MNEQRVEQFLAEVRAESAGWPPAISRHPELPGYLDELATYLHMPGHERRIHLQPRLGEKQPVTPLDPYYFYQDSWAAGRVMAIQPRQWVDVGSTALLVGIFSHIAPTISVDIRPLPVRLPNLECRRGSITALPFADRGISGLSSLCVIEHVGLGRYGDPIDTEGSRKAFAEIGRVMAPGGHCLLSVPVALHGSVVFNAHRIFTREEVMSALSHFQLMEEQLLFPEPGPAGRLAELAADGFAVWCAHFVAAA